MFFYISTLAFMVLLSLNSEFEFEFKKKKNLLSLYTHFRKGLEALLAVDTFEGLVVLAVCWLVLCQFLR